MEILWRYHCGETIAETMRAVKMTRKKRWQMDRAGPRHGGGSGARRLLSSSPPEPFQIRAYADSRVLAEHCRDAVWEDGAHIFEANRGGVLGGASRMNPVGDRGDQRRSRRSPLEEVRGPSRRRFEFVCWASGTSVDKSVEAAGLGARARSLGKKIGLGSSPAPLGEESLSRRSYPRRDLSRSGRQRQALRALLPRGDFFAAASSPLT